MNNSKINIIYEDTNILVVNKKHNEEISISDFIPLNILSKETSGIVVFLKNKNIKVKTKCSYLGIIEGYLEKEILDCRVITRKEKCSIINLTSNLSDLVLREKLMNNNHPVIGDYKYKSIINPIKRICLHLYKIELEYELNSKTIYSEIPDSFKIFSS